MGQKKLWQPRPPPMYLGMFHDLSQYFNNFNMGPQSAPFSAMWSQYQYPPWQQWVPQASLNIS